MQAVDLSTLDFAAFDAVEEGEALLSDHQEWLKQRKGKFTASEIHRLMTKPEDDFLSKGAETYCKEKAVEVITELDDEGYISPAMQWGIDHELEAIEAFTEQTGFKVVYTGENQKFIASACGQWGGTPDGQTMEGGVEVKCPNSTTHFDYLAIETGLHLKRIKKEYYWQIQACMELTGSDTWFFVSYDPRFFKESHQLHAVEIKRNQEDIDLMLNKIKLAAECRDSLIARLG